MKKLLSAIIAAALVFSVFTGTLVSAETVSKGKPTGFDTIQALYAHAVVDTDEGEAWQIWIGNGANFKFYLPTSADQNKVDIYNGFDSEVDFNGVVIPSGETQSVAYNTGDSYTVNAGGRTYNVSFMKSNAEAAIYINNTSQNGYGNNLLDYLNADKENSASATGAIVDSEGKINNTPIKKIKGRGNTTWTGTDKKSYNITYDKKVSIAGMDSNKKYSILANFQDDSLSRNRFLYDLSDAVGMPYASDSRYVDFYINGSYRGSYLMAEKVEAGGLVYDVDDKAYIDAEGNLKDDFSFIAEVDAGAVEGVDYFTTLSNGIKITIKAPELDPIDPYYNEVKSYVREKFNRFMSVASSEDGKVSDVADVDSVAKLYLINELGKNWDSGVSSTFFVYKPDSDGNYKFFGSPVWDYDNSLGNAVGVYYELNDMGLSESDYTNYPGWWCRYKGRSRRGGTSNNIINNLSLNKEVQSVVPTIWFEKFVPALNHFSGKSFDENINKELYTAEHYLELESASASMNYDFGWEIVTGSWIADHSNIKMADFDDFTMTYSTGENKRYDQSNYESMFNYAADWMTCRAAWLSSQFKDDYLSTFMKGDANRNGEIEITDVTRIQIMINQMTEYSFVDKLMYDTNNDGMVDITDATKLQKVIAELEDMGENPTDPVVDPTNPDVDPTNPDVKPTNPDYYSVTFTDTLGWGDTIYCYYWSNSWNGSGGGVNMTQWPGEKMTKIGENTFTFDVPVQATYIIFNNEISQTENTLIDPSKLNFYTTSEMSERGRYICVAE